MALFSWVYLATVAGGALATALIADVLRQVAAINPRWSGLVVAVLIQIGAWWFITDKSADAFALALLNSFVVYAAANTGQAVLGARRKQPALVLPDEQTSLLDPWW